ncbi:hypothetical protein R3W88_016254 [Solanum pinnatisectum]|uniref:Protein kinase domain-containing protein n=1 Tax=Solanum pinnatisectum TaxID=50273 RepID=A0AAV9KX53_9SOLN|nr:hypothetical protein R3W88_016254 [Solanum pinnatisectum]
MENKGIKLMKPLKINLEEYSGREWNLEKFCEKEVLRPNDHLTHTNNKGQTSIRFTDYKYSDQKEIDEDLDDNETTINMEGMNIQIIEENNYEVDRSIEKAKEIYELDKTTIFRCLHVMPLSIISNCGTQFISHFLKSFQKGIGTEVKPLMYYTRIERKHNIVMHVAPNDTHLLSLSIGPMGTYLSIHAPWCVLIMKILSHPNIVNLIKVIDDPTIDNFYMVLEYVEGKWVCEGAGPAGGLGENKARTYLHDTVPSLMYLHSHSIIHGDIKPDNLLVTASGRVKIGDFSVSEAFEMIDSLRRSPGTPIFTAPECYLAADTWVGGVTPYYMVLGKYPFVGDTLQDTYDKIVNNPISLPDDMDPLLKNFLEGLLCKEDPIPRHLCWCQRQKMVKEVSDRNAEDIFT